MKKRTFSTAILGTFRSVIDDRPGGQTLAARHGPGSGTEGLVYLLADHLGSTTLSVDPVANAYNGLPNRLSEQRYKPWGSSRYNAGDLTTDRRYTGQVSEEAGIGLYYYGARWYDPVLGRFIQADTLIPVPYNPLAWDRYAYSYGNPVKYTDPTGHMAQDQGGGCDKDKVGKCKRDYVRGKAAIALATLGGRNDLEALAQIVDTAASVYDGYDEMMPVLSGIFLGVETSNPSTILNAAGHPCNGMGRDPTACPANDELGEYFGDMGFHTDFRDEHNQLFHFWAYVATVASTNGLFAPYGQFVGTMVADAANVAHEIVFPDDQATWQDFALSMRGMQTGYQIGWGFIPPDKLGGHLRYSLGPGGPGSMLVPLMVDLVPLQGNR